MAHAREQQKGEAPREQQERSRDYLAELPKTKAEFLQRHEQWIAQNHKGIAPEAKVKKKAVGEYAEVRKEVCEDVAVKMEDRQLYMVFDGVSGQSGTDGWFASRMAAEILGDRLGVDLDEQVDGWKQRMMMEEGGMSLEEVTDKIRAHMDLSVRNADDLIRLAQQANKDEYGIGSGTTTAIAKVIELPSGNGEEIIHRAFISHMGDSPIYVKRKGGKVEKITVEDTPIQRMLDFGRISEADVDTIRRAKSSYDVPQQLQGAYEQRQTINQALGLYSNYVDAEDAVQPGIKKDLVGFIDLNPGDRLILSSDGFSEQFEENGYPEIEQMMNLTEGDDAAADTIMQERALDRSRKGKRVDYRAKRDDIAAMAVTIRERGAQAPEQAPTGREGLMEKVSSEKVEEWKGALAAHELAVERARYQLEEARKQAQAHGGLVARERIPLERKIMEAEKRALSVRFHLKRAEVAELEHEVPPRLKAGDPVRVKVDSENGRHVDTKQWTVSEYDADRFEYRLESAQGETMQISRFRLETDQPKIVPRRGDIIPLHLSNRIEPGFTVTDVDRRAGKVMVEKKRGQLVEQAEMEGDDLDFAYQGFLHRGQRQKNAMDQLEQEYGRVSQAEQSAATQLANVLRMEARNSAMMRFRERMDEKDQQVVERKAQLEEMRAEVLDMKEGVKASRAKIRRKRNVLSEYNRLTEKQRTKGISNDEISQLRALKIEVYERPGSPELTEEVIEEMQREHEQVLAAYNEQVREYNASVVEFQELKRKVVTSEGS